MNELKTSICIGAGSPELRSTIFHTPDIELIPPDLLLPYYAMFAVTFVAYLLIMVTASRFIVGEAVVNHQSLPFLMGFLICTSMFGVAVTMTEMILFPWHCLLSVYVIPGIVCLLVIFTTPPSVLILAFIFIKCCRSGNCNFGDCFKIFVCAFLSTFLFVWLLICAFPTLLLGFGYPLETLSLVVLHLAFVFAVTVALAVGLSDIIFWWNCYYTKTSKSDHKKCTRQILATIDVMRHRTHVCIILIVVLFVACFAYVVILFGYEFTVVQGYVTSDEASAVVSLFPSLVLFLIGWLIKRRCFADTGKCL